MNKQKISSLLHSTKFQRLCNAGAVAMFTLIVVLGSLPGAREDIGQFASGGVLHSVAYAILGALTFMGGKGIESRRALGAVLKVAAMGAIDECVQSFFPYRTAAMTDWLVDVTAAMVMSVVLWKLWPTLVMQAHE